MLVFAVRFAPKILYYKYAREARRKFWPFNFCPPPPPPSEKRTDAPAYGMALYTRHYTDKTLKLREIYEYASELKVFDIFTI